MEKYNGKSSFLQAIGAIKPPKQSVGPNVRPGMNQVSSSSFLQTISRAVVSTSSINTNLGHHQLSSDSTFQGGKTVHHMGQSGTARSKSKEPTLVKIELGLNSTSQKKQRRSSSSGGDGPIRSGSEVGSHESTLPPPVKKIKLEVGDAGVWEAKREQEETRPSSSSGGGGGGGVLSGSEVLVASNDDDDDDYDDEDDDICPVDYKSRCVILLEEQMQNIVKDFKSCAKELYCLENGGDILDYPNWLKKPNPPLDKFLDELADQYEMSIREIESEEAKVFTSGSGTLPTITPVAISKKLPAAITALQQKQQSEPTESHAKRFVGGFHSVVYGRVQTQWKSSTSAPLTPGGIPLSTTAATTTIGSPTPLNSSCNENSSSSSKAAALVTVSTSPHNQGLIRPIPIVAVPSSAAGLLSESNVSTLPTSSYVNSLESLSVVTATSIMTTPSVMTASIGSLISPNFHHALTSHQEATVEQAKQEAKVLSRVAELRRQGMWSRSRLPKIIEPDRANAHWDMLLREMEWMAVDFAMERRWKMRCSSVVAHSIINSEAISERKRRKRKEEMKKIEMASCVANIVEEFWFTAQEDYLFNNYYDMDKESQKVLETIIISTAKGILGLDKSLVSNIDPNLSHSNSDCYDSDDQEREVRDLVSSAEWPIDNVLKKFYPKMGGLTYDDDIYCDPDNPDNPDYPDNVDFERQENHDIVDFGYLNYSGSDARCGILGDLEKDEEASAYDNIEELLDNISEIRPSIVDLDIHQNSLFNGCLTLRPYQAIGISKLNKFWQQGIPYLEIRDRGLGTKVQLAYHLSSLASQHQEWGCHLVVIGERCDLYSWRSTFAKFTPSLKVKVMVDDYQEEVITTRSIKEAYDNFNVLITFSDHVTQYLASYQTCRWKTLTLDKVVSLNVSQSYTLFQLEYKHLVLFMDIISVPPDVLSLVNPEDEDCNGIQKMTVNVLSEPLKELMSLVLKGKVIDPSFKSDPILASGTDAKNRLTVLTMDEAAKVFKWITTLTLKMDVMEQLQKTNFLTLASTLPTRQASTYNEKFGALIEESPDVQSSEFMYQVNELYKTCAHLEMSMQESDKLLPKSICLELPVDCHKLSDVLCFKKFEDESLPNSLKKLLSLYCWGTGLLEESIIDNFKDDASCPEALCTQTFGPYDLNLLNLVSGSTYDLGWAYHDRLNSLKSVLDMIDQSNIFESLPTNVERSFRNLMWMIRPQKSLPRNLMASTNNLRCRPIEVIKKEVTDYSYGGGVQPSESMEDIDEECKEKHKIFDVLGSDCLKELTSIGQKLYEEKFNKFLISCEATVSHTVDQTLLQKASGNLLCAKRFLEPLINSSNSLVDKCIGRCVNYFDKNIVGLHKGKLSSLSLLLDKERQTMMKDRFILLTCHGVTAQALQLFLNLRGLTYVLLDSCNDGNCIRKSISKFNANKKYNCLVINYQTNSTWELIVRILGEDVVPTARNLIVLDEELCDHIRCSDDHHKHDALLFWQHLAKKMSAFQDLNVIRIYYKNTIEAYQIQQRWSQECIEEFLREGVSRIGILHRMECHSRQSGKGNELQPFDIKSIKNCINVNFDGNESEYDVDDLEFIYTSHQATMKQLGSDNVCPCIGDGSTVYDEVAHKESQKEIHCYALSVIDRQLRTSEMPLRKSGKSYGVKQSKLYSEDVDDFVCNTSTFDPSPYDDLLTYNVDYSTPECFISDLTGEKMPVWAPPTPTQDDEMYFDRNLLLLYESTPMSETQLPSIYVRKGNKRSRIDDSTRGMKYTGRDGKYDHTSLIHRPKSLFERPPVVLQPNTATLSSATSLAYSFNIDRDGRLINKAGIPVGQPYARPPTIPLPNLESHGDQVDWLIHEDWALLQAYQMTCSEGSLLTSDVISNVHPPPQSRLPNWELISCIVNSFGRAFRSARQCRLKYENVILPREEGRSYLDNGQRKIKKTSKGLYKTKANRQLKTIQMYSQDNNRSLITHLSHHFDLLRNFPGKKNTIKSLLSICSQSNKTNHVGFMAEHNIDYEHPYSPSTIAEMKLERANKEKEKRALPERVQHTPSSTPSSSISLAVQQQSSSESSAASSSSSAVAQGTPVSAALTMTIGTALVLPNSQLRMAVPGVVGSQQQQPQVIIQAAQQQLAIVGSAANNSLLGKVPLVSGVSNSGVRNLANLSFVVNQSAAANQQNATFVVSKAQGPITTTVGIVTSLSPSTIKAIRNINPAAASQLAGSINVVQNKTAPSAAAAAAFSPGNRISFRSPGALLNQRLTQKPVVSQQQVTLTPGANIANLQKLNQVSVVSVPAQMSQTFHVKNHPVLLKQKQQTPGSQQQQQQQLTGAVVGRLAGAASGQGTSLQFQHLQIPAKTPLLEVMQQQQQTSSAPQQPQLLSTNFAPTPANVTALIKTVSTNSSLGKVVTPVQNSIRQPQVAKRPTVTAFNIPSQGNRATFVMGKGTGSNQFMYQNPKLVIQQSQIKQPAVQLQQNAILSMASRVSISTIGITPGNTVTIPINPNLTQGMMASGQSVRVTKQVMNSPKVAPLLQHITVRAPQQPQQQQQQQQTPNISGGSSTASGLTVTSTAMASIVRPQQTPSSST